MSLVAYDTAVHPALLFCSMLSLHSWHRRGCKLVQAHTGRFMRIAIAICLSDVSDHTTTTCTRAHTLAFIHVDAGTSILDAGALVAMIPLCTNRCAAVQAQACRVLLSLIGGYGPGWAKRLRAICTAADDAHSEQVCERACLRARAHACVCVRVRVRISLNSGNLGWSPTTPSKRNSLVRVVFAETSRALTRERHGAGRGLLQRPPGQAKCASLQAHLQSEREVDDDVRQVWVMRRRRVWANMPAMMERLDALADAGHLMYSDVRDAMEALRSVQPRLVKLRVYRARIDGGSGLGEAGSCCFLCTSRNERL